MDEEEEAAPKTVKETQWDWELLNDNKALWLRSANDVDEDEYDKFFQAISKVPQSIVTGLMQPRRACKRYSGKGSIALSPSLQCQCFGSLYLAFLLLILHMAARAAC